MQKKAKTQLLEDKEIKLHPSLMYIAFLLSACTTDSVPDEEFEAPTMNFPLLGNVPDRPTPPPPEEIIRQRRHLQSEHDQATEKQRDVIKSTKP